MSLTQTGEKMEIPATRVPAFQAVKQFKQAVVDKRLEAEAA